MYFLVGFVIIFWRESLVALGLWLHLPRGIRILSPAMQQSQGSSSSQIVTLTVAAFSSEADGHPACNVMLPEEHKTWMLRSGQSKGSVILSLSPPSPISAVSFVNAASSAVTLLACSEEVEPAKLEVDVFQQINDEEGTIPWQTICPRNILRTEAEVRCPHDAFRDSLRLQQLPFK
jgi:hypothetical protein